MKKLLILLFSIFVLSGTSFANCYDAESEAYDAFRDAKRAYNSSDLDNCQYYARKAYRHFSDVESYASNCGCDGAESEAYDGYRDAKRAYYSSDLDNCQYYARKAMRHASYTEDYASGCD